MDDVELELVSTVRDAPQSLAEEVAHLIQFKTATLTEIGYQRNGVWNDQTALQKVDHLGLLFGALASSPEGPVAGFGVPLGKLTVALLIFPAVWDWYVRWRERRRGFFTIWEVNMVQLGLAITRAETGWLRQRPNLAGRLKPIPGLGRRLIMRCTRSVRRHPSGCGGWGWRGARRRPRAMVGSERL